MNGWFKKTAELLTPFYGALEKEIFSSDYVPADETVVPVVEGERHKAEKEYLWQARAVMDMLVCFFYDDGSRAGEVIKAKTDELHFKGYLQCDGFRGYTAAFKASPDVTLVFCMVHMRRDFRDAIKENRKVAEHAMAEIQKLYVIEEECDGQHMRYDERRAAYRDEHTRPILDGMNEEVEGGGMHRVKSQDPDRAGHNLRLDTLGRDVRLPEGRQDKARQQPERE